MSVSRKLPTASNKVIKRTKAAYHNVRPTNTRVPACGHYTDNLREEKEKQMQILCFNIQFVGFRSSWKSIARLGPDYKIRAIKEYRDSFLRKNKPFPDLRSAKETVEAYMLKHKSF